MKPVHRLICLVLTFSLSLQTDAAEKYALLIGVSKYEHAQMNRTPLKFPEADAMAVGELLEKSGYTVVLLLGKQATQTAIQNALNKAKSEGTSEGIVLIGMFGHGVQYGNDAYYGPFNTKIREVKDSQGNLIRDKSGELKLEPDPATMIAMRSILDVLTVCGADSKILLADCCRDDPSAARGRAFGSNLQKEGLPRGMAALFACSENEQAFESDEWGHGAFTKALLDECTGASDVTANTLSDALYRRVGSLVKDKTNGRSKQTVNGIVNGFVDLHLVPSALPDLITNSIGMKLKLIPAGESLMGSSDGDVAAALRADPNLKEDNLKAERPQHRVKISHGFYAGVYEVTQGEYEAVMGSNPSWFSTSGIGSGKVSGLKTDRFPVESVSWYDAIAFCNKLSQRDNLAPYYSLTSVERERGSIKSATVTLASGGRQSPDSSGYRLPTEAEWEYMCRGDTTSAYWFGNILNGDKANVDGNYPYGTTNKGAYLERPTTVGSFGANPFGLHDVHGNVWEWCFDVYDENAYGSRSGTTVDPILTSGSEYRVLRGGSWNLGSRLARSAVRDWNSPGFRYYYFGFRVVR